MTRIVRVEKSFIALGSNLDNPVEQVCRAIDKIKRVPNTNVIAESSLYKTKPVGGPKEQPDYINAVVCIETKLSAPELLEYTQNIENEHGRVRLNGERNIPRTLDLDILLYGEYRIELDNLQVPHPRMHLREFVLVPLREVAPLVYEAIISNQWPWLCEKTISYLGSRSCLENDEVRII